MGRELFDTPPQGIFGWRGHRDMGRVVKRTPLFVLASADIMVREEIHRLSRPREGGKEGGRAVDIRLVGIHALDQRDTDKEIHTRLRYHTKVR